MIRIMLLVFMTSLTAFADYTGTVFGVKHFAGGGAAVDMDGAYPNEKMILYVAPADMEAVVALPTVGAKVTASGDIVDYKGKPEIKIHTKEQWRW